MCRPAIRGQRYAPIFSIWLRRSCNPNDRSTVTTPTQSMHLADLTPPGYHGLKPKVSAGGMFFLSSGSRPTNYFQPLRPGDDTCCQRRWTGSPSGLTMATEKPFISTKASAHT